MRGKPIGSKENMKNKPYSKFNLESLCQRRGIDKKFYIVIVKCVCLDILFIGVYWLVKEMKGHNNFQSQYKLVMGMVGQHGEYS